MKKDLDKPIFSIIPFQGYDGMTWFKVQAERPAQDDLPSTTVCFARKEIAEQFITILRARHSARETYVMN